MKRRLQSLLVYGFSLAAMTYAAWQTDVSVLPRVSAEWAKGCCNYSNDCGGSLLCYHNPAAGPCGKGLRNCVNPDGSTYLCEEIYYDYCNDKPFSSESDKGSGGILP